MLVKNFKKANARTMCGIINGERKNAINASRPGKRNRASASAEGIANMMAKLADKNPKPKLNKNASINLGLLRIALNHLSDSPFEGREIKPSPVNATAHTMTSGARINKMNKV